MAKILEESFVTLATNDNYALGAVTLGESLRNVNTNRILTVIITKEVSSAFQAQLRQVFDNILIVDPLNSEDSLNLALLKRPELGVTFTKLHCWRLTQFSKCVFLDADCLILQNVDELFERQEFSAVTDVGWPDCFNSGVFVFVPSIETYSSLLKFATENGSFDGGDQGLLNSYFADWSTSESSRRLPFTYNMTSNVFYSYAPAFKQFGDNVKIVHFIGAQKPWYYSFNFENNSVIGVPGNANETMVTKWWTTFANSVLPKLDLEIKNRLSSQLVNLNSGKNEQEQQSWNQTVSSYQDNTPYVTGSVSSGGVVVGGDQHKTLWEHGQIEYKGRDSFSNIQAHIDSQLEKK